MNTATRQRLREAGRAPRGTYHGRPCLRCGSTLRRKHNADCVRCKRRGINKGNVRQQNNSRRARKRAALVSIPSWRLRHLLEWWREEGCYLCGKPFGPDEMIHVEHLTPLSRGGAHAEPNLGPACVSCNLRKGTKTLPEYRMGAAA